MEQSPSCEDNRFSATQEIPHILWNPKVHYRFTSARHVSISWASSIQSIPPHSTSSRSVLILSSIRRLALPSSVLPSGFPTKTLFTPLHSPHTCHMPHHLIFLDFITHTILGEQYISWSSSICIFLNSPVTSSLLGPNILLSTLLSNTLNLRSSFNVSDQVSHPYKIRQNYGSVYLNLDMNIRSWF